MSNMSSKKRYLKKIIRHFNYILKRADNSSDHYI